jgi:asparagine synthase (glutamine-hydrolysing)
MSRLTDTPVKTFSIGVSEDTRYDETSYAAVVAKKFNTDHHTFVVTPSTIDLIETLIRHYDEPFGDASAIPTYIVSNLTRQHVTVALNGDGGDELFAGYTRFIAAAYSEHVPVPVRRLLHRLSSSIPLSRSGRGMMARARRLFSVFNKSLLERYVNWVAYVQLDDALQMLDPGAFPASGQVAYRDTVYAYFSEHLKGLEPASLLTQLLYLNFKTYLPDDLLVKMDRMSMANSLEGRSPFLDRELIEYAFTMPDHLKLKGFTTKYCLKQTFQDILPRQIRRRGKMGFGVPLGAWFRTKLRDYLREHILAEDARISGYLRPGEVRRIFEEHQQGMRDNGLKLWLLLTLELWLRNLQKGTIQ